MRKSSIVKEIQTQLENLKNLFFSGSFLIETEDGFRWIFYFRLGRIYWQNGGINSLERWQRYLKYYCDDSKSDELIPFLSITGMEYEYQALIYLQKNQIISRENINQFVSSITSEALLEIMLDIYNNNKIVNYKTINDDTFITIFSLVEPLNIFEETQKLFQEWIEAGLSGYHPSFFPIIKKPELLNNNSKITLKSEILDLIDGSNNIYSLALQTQKSIVEVTKFLIPFVGKRIIKFYTLEPPGKNSNKLKKIPENNKSSSLIACVDDSLSVCRTLEKIMTEAGYRFLGINDSYKAISILLKNQPDFIFLDLIMPVANGYELCSQLRRIPKFQSVPIVILTGKDSLVDRVRAKMVGSTDFLNKPIKKEEVLNMINLYINLKI